MIGVLDGGNWDAVLKRITAGMPYTGQSSWYNLVKSCQRNVPTSAKSKAAFMSPADQHF